MPIDHHDAGGEAPSTATRLFIAAVLGVPGFVTGMIAVWMLSDLPGVPIGNRAALPAGIVLGLACAVTGYRASDKTVDALGDVWQLLWKLSAGILGTIRSLIR